MQANYRPSPQTGAGAAAAVTIVRKFCGLTGHHLPHFDCGGAETRAPPLCGGGADE